MSNRDTARAALREAKDCAGEPEAPAGYAATMAVTALGYAMLDVADAIRDLGPLVSECAGAIRGAAASTPPR